MSQMPMWMMEFIIFVRKWDGFSVERRFFCAKKLKFIRKSVFFYVYEYVGNAY